MSEEATLKTELYGKLAIKHGDKKKCLQALYCTEIVTNLFSLIL